MRRDPLGPASVRDGRIGWIAAALVAALVVALVLGGAVDARRLAAALVAAKGWAGGHVVVAALGYVALYVVFSALSLPGAGAVSLAGGALFGPWLGVPLVSFASTLGATIAMLMARHLLRGAVEARFPQWAGKVDRGVARDGARYLFAARLTPFVPFSAVNLAVGLTRMPTLTFAAVTALGAAPIVVLYVVAGQQFASIASPRDVLSARVALALLALAALPFAAKAIGRRREARRDEARRRD
jgi:uncharacterized membrane protein YdjX (TVP38/TMEM64 family)